MTEPIARLTAALADRYRLERELGQGGMATVYLAHDLKHDRRVAIKVLRPELAAVIGAERFLSEIRTTANLQHPHILPLFDSGATTSHPERGEGSGGLATESLYYVMPYVEGESLRDRLTRDKQLPIGDAVRIAREVADGLDYAHRRGVVHRDIKPENVLLHDGRALIADFGIALAASKAGESRMTQTGMSLGTPAYMSPEQAMGDREIGPRSDIYALGAMTYEMLLGDPPFTGSTAQAIVAKAMTEKPIAPARLRDTIPPAVEDAVLTALQKLPADRFATAKEFADALTRDVSSSRSATRVLPATVVTASPWKRIAAVLGACTVGALAFGGWTLARRPVSTGPLVYDAALPDSAPMAFAAGTSITGYGAAVRNISVAPDGSFALYTSLQGTTSQLWYRSLLDGTARPIAGTAGGDAPRVSPDGTRVAFFVGSRVVLAPVAGGEPRTLFEAKAVTYLDWISPTSLILGDEDGYRVHWLDPEAGPVRNGRTARCIQGRWSPELRILTCRLNNVATIMEPESGKTWSIHTTAPGGGDGALLTGSGVRILGGDLLVYVSADGELRAAPYDAAARRAGRPVTLTKGVRAEAIGEAQFDVTAGGTLVYAPGVNAEIGRIVRARPGNEPVPVTSEAAAFQRFDLSPDGRWLAAVTQTTDGQELRIYDQRGGQRTTWLQAEVVRHPMWSPSGSRLIVTIKNGDRHAVLSGVPGSGLPPDTLLAGDSASVAFDVVDFPNDRELIGQNWRWSLVYRTDPTTTPLRLDTLITEARFLTVAPGGRLMAYMNVVGTSIVVTSHPTPGHRWQVAADGAEPQWLAPGQLLYRVGATWFLAKLDPATGEPLGTPQTWGKDPRFSDTSGWSNRLSHDGGILYVQGPPITSGTYLRIVPGWVAQARAAVKEANR